MIITKEAKLYPNKSQLQALDNLLEEARLIYNQCLEIKMTAWNKEKINVSRFDLQKKMNGVGLLPATVRQMIIYRLNKAYQTFFRKGGFPRFKQFGRYRSIELRQRNRDYWIDDKLKLWPKFIKGSIRFKGLTKLENPTQAKLVKRASGWYLQISDDVEIKTRKNKKEIGIDLGIINYLADSKGNKVSYPKFLKKSEQKLAGHQRLLSRQIKGSNRYKKQVNRLAKTHEKIGNQRKDFLHKLSREYVNKYGIIYAENLNVKGMLENCLFSKSISDASWSMFLNMIQYKLKMLTGELILVPPQFTSQKCSNCGEIVKKSLSVRTHICPYCNLVEDRDVNAALNILRLGQSLRLAEKT